MNKETLYKAFETKYEELKAALAGDDLEKMKKLTLEVHAMVHPAEVSGASEKTVADYVLDYMLAGNQNVLVPRQIWDTDLHYAGTDMVPLCWQFWPDFQRRMAEENRRRDHGYRKRAGAGRSEGLRRENQRGSPARLYDHRGKEYADHPGKAYAGRDQVHGARRMGHEDPGSRRGHHGFPLRVAAGVLGQADPGRNDPDPHDVSSHDAPSGLYRSSVDYRLMDNKTMPSTSPEVLFS